MSVVTPLKRIGLDPGNPRWRIYAHIARVTAGRVVAKARAWRVHQAVPAVAGAGLISAAGGLRFGLWAGLGIAGLFCLRFDSRIS